MFNPPHAGELLSEILESKSLCVEEFAKRAVLSESEARKLLAGQLPITPALAERLSPIIGSSTQFWLNLQSNYDKDQI